MQTRMQRRLTVVNPAAGVDRDQDVIVKAGGVVVGRAAKEAARADAPGRRTGEILARHGGEGFLDPRIAHARAPRDFGGVGLPAFDNSVLHAARRPPPRLFSSGSHNTPPLASPH